MRCASTINMAALLDARHAIRRFLSSPGLTLVATLTLALGIGATTAIYSVVDALMLRPLPYGDPGRLVDLGTQTQTGALRYFDADQIAALRTRTDLFASVDAFNFTAGMLVGGDEAVQSAGAVVGGELMQTLAVPPQLGRLIDRSDVAEGRQVIVLSDGLWRSRFGADPAVVGRTVRLDDKVVEVIGVMPPTFKFPTVRQEFWLPFNPSAMPGGQRPMFAIGRLRGNRAIAEARALVESSSIDVRNRQGALVPTPLRIVPPLGRFLNAPVRTAIYLLAGAVILVLLIACANIANLLLVQNAGRYREIAVRTALGASHGALVRQFLVESALLSAAGGALGLLVAQWFIDIVATSAPPNSGIISVNAFGVDSRAVLFALAATAMAACLSGIFPALRGARSGSHDALRYGGRSATDGPKQERLRNVFVVVQLAVSVVLLVGATLLARTFVQLVRTDPGFEPRGLAMASLELPRWKYQNSTARREFFEGLAGRIRSLPAVSGATLSSGGGISFGMTFEVEGQGIVLDDPKIEVPHSSVDTEYFSVMRIPITAGRGFTTEDVAASPRAIVINRAMASRLWRGAEPVGQRVRMGTGPADHWYTVVGVAGDTYEHDYARTQAPPTFYLPIGQAGIGPAMTITARTAGDPATLLPLIREQVRAVDRAQPIWRLRTGPTEFAEFLALPRFYTLLMGVLAALGLVIAAVGLYGILSYSISQRTREFGVRLALGAQRTEVFRMVLFSGGSVTALGLLAGIAGSVVMTRWIESMLIDVPRLDPISYAAATLLFGLIAFAACWIPARRATSVDPIVALRHE
jgi:putative ABC transport system permease protein